MNEYNATKILSSYELIERDLLAFLDVVPFEDVNKGTWSPKLVGILLDVGSLVDSIFRIAAPPKMARTTGKIIKRDEMTITDFRRIFSTRFALENTRTLAYFSPPIILEPFKDFKGQSPSWWIRYNNVKHNRLKNSSEATVEVVLDAVSGLFQLIAQYPAMYPYLVRQNWSESTYSLDYIIPLMSSEDRIQKMSTSAIQGTHLIQTKLFATTIGPLVFPKKIQDIEPLYYEPPRRLMTFLGKGF